MYYVLYKLDVCKGTILHIWQQLTLEMDISTVCSTYSELVWNMGGDFRKRNNFFILEINLWFHAVTICKIPKNVQYS